MDGAIAHFVSLNFTQVISIFFNFHMVKLKTIINQKQHDNNPIIESSDIRFWIILLCFIKIHKEVYGSMKITQKAKTKNHKNSKLSLFMSINM